MHGKSADALSTTSHGYEEEPVTKRSPLKEGVLAGLIGAATIALWFLVLDTFQGRALHTPTVLGTAFFRGGEGLDAVETLPVAIEMVALYSLMHWLAFTVMGTIAAYVVAAAARARALWTSILAFFVLFVALEFGFRLVGAMLLTQEALYALAWQNVMTGNLLAAAAMGAFLLQRHRVTGRAANA